MFFYVISCIALLVIAATMLARANDLRWRSGFHWNARLIGFILTGFAPFGIMGWEWFAEQWPSLYEVLFRFGLMLVFLTTPYLPPWWKWISGTDNGDNPWYSDDRRKKDGE